MQTVYNYGKNDFVEKVWDYIVKALDEQMQNGRYTGLQILINKHGGTTILILETNNKFVSFKRLEGNYESFIIRMYDKQYLYPELMYSENILYDYLYGIEVRNQMTGNSAYFKFEH